MKLSKDLRKLLEHLRNQIRDLHVGYVKDELPEPLKVTIDRITDVLQDNYSIEIGEVVAEAKK